MHPLKRFELPQQGYAIANRMMHWLSSFLVKPWDQRLLGIGALDIQTILDVGANEGQFSRQMRRIFPQAHIYAFEPLPGAFKALQRWGDRQNGQVTVFPYALGDRVQQTEIKQHLYFNASSSLLSTTELCEQLYPITGKQKAIAIEQTTLDSLFAEQMLVPDILIKLDVQGYEDRVICGGKALFQRASACIVEISLDTLYEGQANFSRIFELLTRLGFRYAGNLDQMTAKDGHVVYCNAVFLKQ